LLIGGKAIPRRTTRNSLGADPSDLTDNEGSLLAVIQRQQPVTAYQVMRIYELSPVSSFNTSKGGLYPAINRLRERGFLSAQVIEGDKRGSERLSCTPAGVAAVKQWVKDLRDTHFLPVDPLRTKLMSFNLLSRDEQIEWIVDAKAQLAAKLEEVEVYDTTIEIPFQALVHDNAVTALRTRMQWLDRLMQYVVKGTEPA
jgi:DNA-binding PadR family transcriptional regulator